MNKPSTGVTLIDTLIVVAVLVMVATIAVPGYLQSTQRATFSEPPHATTPARTNPAGDRAAPRNLPATSADVGVSATTDPSRFVSNVECNTANGRVEVTAHAGLIDAWETSALRLAPRLNADNGEHDASSDGNPDDPLNNRG